MELRHLKYFVAVAEHLSFSKAAEALFTSQPSLSQQIKDLETALKVPLFNRTKKKVELTKEGEALLPYAIDVLNQANYTITATQETVKKIHNHLTIGFVPVVETTIFPKLLPLLKSAYTDIAIQLKSLTVAEQLNALKTHTIDIGFIREKVSTDTLTSKLVFRENMIAIFPHDHALARRDSLSLADLNGHKLVLPLEERSPSLYKIVYNFLTRKQVAFTVVQSTGNIFSTINCVSMGLGYAILPAYITDVVKNNPNIIIRSFDVELPLVDLFVVYPKTKPNPLLSHVIQLLETLY